MELGLHGPQLTICSACASSIDAIGLAARLIESGQVDVAIAGGAEGGNGTNDDFVPSTFYAQRAYGMTTFVPGAPEASLPMDVRRSGVVTGEGAGIVILERKAHAEARNARILGRVRGWGTVADGYHPSAPEPSGQWEAEAMRQALLDANASRSTSTPYSRTRPARRRATGPRSRPSTSCIRTARRRSMSPRSRGTSVTPAPPRA